MCGEGIVHIVAQPSRKCHYSVQSMFKPPTGIEHQLRGSLVQMNFELLRVSVEIIIHHGPGV